jgi:hypothetical protein
VHTVVFIDRIERAGATLQLVTEDFEKSATGKFLRNAKSCAAELELEKIAERSQRGRRARVASGKPIAGPRPAYGYVWNADKSRYLTDPDTAPIVRLIFDWALDGVTLRGIATRLHERGIPSPTGQERWSITAIRGLLLRHVYTGDAMAYAKGAIRRPSGGYSRRPGTPEELVPVPNVAEPIITHEERAAIVSRLTANKLHAVRNNRAPEATLLRTGFAVCGHCGCVLLVANGSSGGETARYRCAERNRYDHGCPQPSITASLVDGPVWDRVCAVLRDPATIERELGKHRSGGGLDRDLAAIETRIETNATRRTRLVRALADLDDEADIAQVKAQLRLLSETQKTLEADRDDLARRMADAEADRARVRSLTDWCEHFGAKLATATYEQKRTALEALGVKVRVYRLGTVDAEGNPNPRWDLTMRPMSAGSPIVYTPTGRTSTTRRGSPSGVRGWVST